MRRVDLAVLAGESLMRSEVYFLPAQCEVHMNLRIHVYRFIVQ
jgi:hypothetical protein